LALFPVVAFVEKRRGQGQQQKKRHYKLILVEGKFQFLFDFDKPNIQFLGIPLHRLAQFSIVFQ